MTYLETLGLSIEGFVKRNRVSPRAGVLTGPKHIYVGYERLILPAGTEVYWYPWGVNVVRVPYVGFLGDGEIVFDATNNL